MFAYLDGYMCVCGQIMRTILGPMLWDHGWSKKNVYPSITKSHFFSKIFPQKNSNYFNNKNISKSFHKKIKQFSQKIYNDFKNKSPNIYKTFVKHFQNKSHKTFYQKSQTFFKQMFNKIGTMCPRIRLYVNDGLMEPFRGDWAFLGFVVHLRRFTPLFMTTPPPN